MFKPRLACMAAASFMGALLVTAAVAPADAQNLHSKGPVVVTAPREGPLVEQVPFGDLSLTTGHDRTVLYRRVALAVNKVCPDLDEDGFFYDTLGCKNFAWDGARPQMSAAIKAAKSGAVVAMTIEVSAAPVK
jgi:UrcA family protein